jgi:hypothetical protein
MRDSWAVDLCLVFAMPGTPGGIKATRKGTLAFPNRGNPMSYRQSDHRRMLGELTPGIENYMREQVIRSLLKPEPQGGGGAATALDHLGRRTGDLTGHRKCKRHRDSKRVHHDQKIVFDNSR